MRTDRRRFLTRSMLAVGGITALTDSTRAAIRQATPKVGPRTGEEWDQWSASLRRQIPASTHSRYFQTAGIGACPDRVIEEVTANLRFQNRSPADAKISATMAEIEPRLRARLARSLGADDDEVALTHSTSEGINIVSWSLPWRSGDEVIVTNQEHPSNIIPWYNLRDRFGVVFKQIELDADGDARQRVLEALSDATRLVSLSHVSRNNGHTITREESAELASELRRRNIRFHLDGAQGPGCVPVSFGELGCDYYSTCGHKWLLGPKGTGALLVRRDVLDDTLLSWTGAHSHDSMDYEGHYTLKPDASRFEFGTRALATFAGFDEALRFWDELGWEAAFERMQSLVSHAVERIDRSAKLELSSPRTLAHRSAIVAVRLPEGIDATALYHRLREDEHVLGSPVRDERDFRLAIHCFNTEDDITEALTAVERLV